jgi:maleylpyruvate isomerase
MSDASALDEELVTRLGWMRAGTAFFIAQVAGLSDNDLLEASRLPGWTRRHVLSHMANNAAALMNLLDWARTGIETPMYPSREARAADIESGSLRPAAELRADAVESAERFVAATNAMPTTGWGAPVRTALDLPVTGAEVPWMRTREVWVHGVDLGGAATFADIDGAVAAALLDEAARSFAGRGDCPAVRLVVGDGDSFSIGPMGTRATEVHGTVHSLAAWLLGRSDGADLDILGLLPVLPTWL